MRWVGNVACMGRDENACSILVRKPEGKDYVGDIDVHWRVILKWIIRK
jgi:hypothetical protein